MIYIHTLCCLYTLQGLSRRGISPVLTAHHVSMKGSPGPNFPSNQDAHPMRIFTHPMHQGFNNFRIFRCACFGDRRVCKKCQKMRIGCACIADRRVCEKMRVGCALFGIFYSLNRHFEALINAQLKGILRHSSFRQ